jgi:pimeloyl-ACP methyl ester carboxylesterase
MATDPPVILVHGLGSSFEHNWRATGWVDLLADEGREVVGVDLPGHGTMREQNPSALSPAQAVLAAGFLRAGHPAVTLADVARIEVPTLVVLGDQDFAGPADTLLGALRHGELVTLRGVDHFATPSDYGCIDAVLKFLAR